MKFLYFILFCIVIVLIYYFVIYWYISVPIIFILLIIIIFLIIFKKNKKNNNSNIRIDNEQFKKQKNIVKGDLGEEIVKNEINKFLDEKNIKFLLYNDLYIPNKIENIKKYHK